MLGSSLPEDSRIVSSLQDEEGSMASPSLPFTVATSKAGCYELVAKDCTGAKQLSFPRGKRVFQHVDGVVSVRPM